MSICENNPTLNNQGDYPLHYDVRDIEILGIDENGEENVLVATDGGITLTKLDIYWYIPPPPYGELTFENLNGSYLPIGEFMGIGVSHSLNEFIIGGAMHCFSHKLENNNWQLFGINDGGIVK